MVTDIITVLQWLELALCRFMPNNLSPQFVLVGSLAEGTRIHAATEADVTMRFPVLENTPLSIGKDDAFSLHADEPNLPLEQFLNGSKFSYEKFLKYLLERISKILVDNGDKIRSKTRGRIALPEWYKSFIDGSSQADVCCPNRKVDEFQGTYFTHCTNCIFPVVQTKCGICLLLPWFSDEFNREEILTVDLIPVLPVKGSSLNGLFRSVTTTLLKFRPPNWLNHITGVMKRDRILPESLKKDAEEVKVIPVGMKLVHFGRERNFIIRPAQRLQMSNFEKDQDLKDTYCKVKSLKYLLNIDISSYFIKKVILTEEMMRKIKSCSYSLDKIFEVLSHQDLKPKFAEIIDFEQWSKDSNHIPILQDKLFRTEK